MPTEDTAADAAPADAAVAVETPPDRLAADPSSPYFNADFLQRGVGVRFKGVEKFNVEEYCVSESWVRLPVGKGTDRRGRPLLIKLTGDVEVWFK
ncbi:DUF3297 family protein [Siculibacillus lacustris]|uniref:DUF3297 family protein n=1 Tax=Siculibacillus lacustris TaxID=1549641 RepID=UPI001D184E79|nr:DUF3297 family protein [Siculibacillus lacustris]